MTRDQRPLRDAVQVTLPAAWTHEAPGPVSRTV